MEQVCLARNKLYNKDKVSCCNDDLSQSHFLNMLCVDLKLGPKIWTILQIEHVSSSQPNGNNDSDDGDRGDALVHWEQ